MLYFSTEDRNAEQEGAAGKIGRDTPLIASRRLWSDYWWAVFWLRLGGYYSPASSQGPATTIQLLLQDMQGPPFSLRGDEKSVRRAANAVDAFGWLSLHHAVRAM